MPGVLIGVDDIKVDIRFKKIKHVYLRVKSPDGRVQVSAPKHLKTTEVRDFIQARLGLIRKWEKSWALKWKKYLSSA